jgi:outer membrane protein OmpA-like peptidoglycan-associated protein
MNSPRLGAVRAAAALVAVAAVVAGCGNRAADADRRLPGSGTEIGWWATTTSTTSTTPIEPGVITTTLSTPSDVLFQFGSAALTPTAGGTLDDVARTLSDERVQSVTVVGHTDHLGTNHDDLGHARATAVIAYLTNSRVEASKFESAVTAGFDEPLCPEVRPDGTDDADCRARNRRVTITYTTVESGQ